MSNVIEPFKRFVSFPFLGPLLSSTHRELTSLVQILIDFLFPMIISHKSCSIWLHNFAVEDSNAKRFMFTDRRQVILKAHFAFGQVSLKGMFIK